jgi:hypothetical protein
MRKIKSFILIAYFIKYNMSTAIRSAVNRRVNTPQAPVQSQGIPQNRAVPTVGFQPSPEPQFQAQQQQMQQQQQQMQPQQRMGTNMTLQQSFDLVFNRLTILDKSVQQLQQGGGATDGATGGIDEATINGIVEEFNSRTEILAGEIGELKDMLLKLQTYTLEVNQKLFAQLNPDGINFVAEDA